MRITIPDVYWQNLKREVQDVDFCPLCCNHPSHGHADDCPLRDRRRKQEEDDD